LIVEDSPFHPHAGQRHPHEIRTGAIEGDLVESGAEFCLVVAVPTTSMAPSGRVPPNLTWLGPSERLLY
jgi:hypothetical protein